MVHSKAKLKSNGDKASPCFRQFWIGNVPDKYLPIRPNNNNPSQVSSIQLFIYSHAYSTVQSLVTKRA
jgi:hypothetical protein